MNKQDNLRKINDKLNDNNFAARKRIDKLKGKLLYIESLNVIWRYKDRIKELERKILINEQKVRFNLMVIASGC